MTWMNGLNTKEIMPGVRPTGRRGRLLRRSAIATLMAGAVVGVGAFGEMSAIANSGDLLAQTSADPSSSSDAEASSPDTTTSTADINRFNCQVQAGEYTVMYNPESQPDAYAWASPGDMGGGWSADRRCTEIGRRLETYRPDGLLELRTGVENGYNTVCATTEQNPTCRIVFTVPEGQDPIMTRDRVFENLAAANSGQETDAVNTFNSGGSYQILERIGSEIGLDLSAITGRGRSRATRAASINLRPFLDPADGGTGEYLRSTPGSAPARLNPGDFR
ncbi:MAG: COP23 domain-containing protein [Elainellaceae cyanobacterium]